MESNEKKKILILCTGNSCRSQMAEGIAREAGWQAYSAGTDPESAVNPYAVKVMAEMGIDISHHTPQSISEYINDNFYIVATVCDNAKENCPVFTESCEYQIHHGFEDPADASGNDKEITKVYRRVRDEIQMWVDAITEDYFNN